MKVFLYLTIAFAIAAVVLSDKDDHHKKKGDRSHHEKNHHGERSHHDSKKNKNHSQNRNHGHANHERTYEEPIVTESAVTSNTILTDNIRQIVRPWCNIRQMRVCEGYNCPILTCANYDNEVENWGKCLYDTDNNFTNLKWCKRLTVDRSTKCICSFGLVLDEETGNCVKKSDCAVVDTTSTSTTTTSWFQTRSTSTEGGPNIFDLQSAF